MDNHLLNEISESGLVDLCDGDTCRIETLMSMPLSGDAPEILFKSVRALDAWGERSLGVTNGILSYWVGRAIYWRDESVIGIIRSLIRRIMVVKKEEDQLESLSVNKIYLRWESMVNVLEDRMHVLCYNDQEKIQREKL